MKKRRRLAVVLLVVLAVGTVVVGRRLDWWEAEPERRTEAFTFRDGFEDATALADLCPRDASRWHGFQQEPKDRPDLRTVDLTTEHVHSGRQALKCSAGAKVGGSLVKADVQLGGLHFTKGDEVWFSGWFFLEGGGDAKHVFLWDLEASGKYGSPGRRVYLQEGECLASDLKWWGAPTFRPAAGMRRPFPRDRWVRLKVYLLLSEGDGVMRVWQDDELVLEGHGQTLPTAKAVYDRLQVGITANGNTESRHTLHVDDVVISNRPLK